MWQVLLGAASMALVVVYPLMKRYSDWPQLVLGTFSGRNGSNFGHF
jgi:4-hydroxybenzoate polyprenyltransferase